MDQAATQYFQSSYILQSEEYSLQSLFLTTVHDWLTPWLNTGGGIDLYYSLPDVLQNLLVPARRVWAWRLQVWKWTIGAASVFLKPSVVLLLSLAMDDGEFTIIMIWSLCYALWHIQHGGRTALLLVLMFGVVLLRIFHTYHRVK